MYDLTRPLSNDIEYYPGDPIPFFTPIYGEDYRITEIHMGSHTGTHLDAPAHYCDMGATVVSIPLDLLVGPCFILEVTDSTQIYEADLQPFDQYIIASTRLLIRGGGRAGFMPCAAKWLSQYCVCVGIDSLSISYPGYDREVHTTLMNAGVIILESLTFPAPLSGEYMLIALPLLLLGADGAPARVIVCDTCL
jgi:arylformamidase